MKRNKKLFIIVALCILAVGMGIGYSILSQQLKIQGNVAVKTNFDVAITGIERYRHNGFEVGNRPGPEWLYETDRVTELSEATFTETTATFNVRMQTNSTISYLVTIKNRGSIPAVFDPVVIDKTGNVDIEIVTPMDLDDGFLDAGAEVKYLVILKYYLSEDMDDATESNITINFNEKQTSTDGRIINPTLIFENHYFSSISGNGDTYTFRMFNPGASGAITFYESIDGSEYTLINTISEYNERNDDNSAIVSESFNYGYLTYMVPKNLTSGVHNIKIKYIFNFGTGTRESNELIITHYVD